MLQPQGKCANVCAFSRHKFFPITASISPLRLENGRLPDFHSRVHWPRCSRFMAAETTRASSIVLHAPRDHSFVILQSQSKTRSMFISGASSVPASTSFAQLLLKALCVFIDRGSVV